MDDAHSELEGSTDSLYYPVRRPDQQRLTQIPFTQNSGHPHSTPRPPKITEGTRATGYWDAPAPDDELEAYARGYAEGAAAKQAGMTGTDNPYSSDNVVRRLAVERGIDPTTLKLRR